MCSVRFEKKNFKKHIGKIILVYLNVQKNYFNVQNMQKNNYNINFV